MFITFEGIEGSGKTTQITLLYEYLKDRGYEVIKTREPGGTEIGEILRDILLDKKRFINPKTELFLIMAIRAQHMEDVIIPALKEKKIVLCDRFSDATYAYQGSGRGIDPHIIKITNEFATKGITPDLTVLIDIDVHSGLGSRIRERGQTDRFESEEDSFHKKVREGYLKLSREHKERFLVVDGNEPVDKIHRIIRDRVEGLIDQRRF